MTARCGLLIACSACVVTLIVGCTEPASTVRLTIEFTTMGGYGGDKLEIRVLTSGDTEVARQTISSISASQFSLSFAGLDAGRAYRVDFYVDVSGNGRYDAPPADHAWRLEVAPMEGDTTIPFTPGGAFTDIDFPIPVATSPVANGTIAPGEYRHAVTDPTTAMTVHWQNDATTLYVALVAPGVGWLAIGFDPVNKMEGANIIIGYVSGGVLTIDDQYGSGPHNHAADEHDDILSSGGREAGGATTLEFSIPMDSRDPQDKRLEPGERYPIILSYHLTEDTLVTYHATARSTTHIRLD